MISHFVIQTSTEVFKRFKFNDDDSSRANSGALFMASGLIVYL